VPRGAAPAAAPRLGTRFTVRQRLFALGDDYWVEDEQGRKAVQVDGKLLRLRDTLVIRGADGEELYRVTARVADVRETMDVRRPDGSTAAVVHNALFSPLRDRWKIEVPGGEGMVAAGNILQHEYTLRRGGRIPVAVVSKRWLRLRDTYGVEVADDADAPLVLAIAIVIDQMAHESGGDRGSPLDVL
jgi:uncharacterized protein YxjI